MLVTLLNIIILLMVFITFFILITGLIKTARSDNTGDTTNKFMRYRVYFQFIAIIILIIAIYAKKQLVG